MPNNVKSKAHPKFTVLSAESMKTNGTCLQGYLNSTYANIVGLFGEPLDGCGDSYKTDAEWGIEFEDGTVATIYNYKSGKNYLGDNGPPTEAITDWHIGGHDRKVVDLIAKLFPEQTIDLFAP